MQEEVEPVDGPHQLAPEEHPELLVEMGRGKGRKAQREAEKDDRPGKVEKGSYITIVA